jgi:hypothetical protein
MAFIGRVLIENISAGFCSICELALNFYLHRTEYASQKMIKGKKRKKEELDISYSFSTLSELQIIFISLYFATIYKGSRSTSQLDCILDGCSTFAS